MRVTVLGGTGFIGRAISRRLLRRGHQVLLVHRGLAEPSELGGAEHLHVNRESLLDVRASLCSFSPDAVVDCYALTRADAAQAVAAFRGLPAVVLSSQDVYAAWSGFVTDTRVSDGPLSENAPLRKSRYLYAESAPPGVPRDYEKLDVEDAWKTYGATILRLPMVYGPYDRQCREGFVIRRIAAGRRRIPVGAANLKLSRAYVHDVAGAVEAALYAPAARGQTINIAEPEPYDIGSWIRQIAAGMDADLELVRVEEDVLAPDLLLTATRSQHVVADVTRARALLDWRPMSIDQKVARSTKWHLRHGTFVSWTAADDAIDDTALAAAC
ncbi:NAD-dependent epimerase/dehydratase family protein [Blastococcus sp. Marseille-P5729]|uniref:NAD-dependent epimerase/dehydratase family protein n=1 Tax=Blastococcus sp. Marseille-P5729 TaxID=2086582 RepID=UPI000D0E49BF|nr:NAD-dependent epimerase/dehydratase family protein [Blastococcus sp. Marseille-P5729]